MGRSIFDQFAGKTPQQIADEYADRPDELRQLRDQIAQQVADVRGVTPGSGVGFLDRAALSFTGTPQGAENMLRQRGYQPVRLPDGALGVYKDGKVQRVDEQGLALGDVADMAGDVPATLLGTIGAIGGTAATPFTGPVAPTMPFVGAGAGSALGEVVKQGIGQALGSGEDMSGRDIAMEGALGVAGEGVGRILGKVLRGPFHTAGAAPRAARRMANIENIDTRLGTNLVDLAPVSTRGDSKFLGDIEQTVRQSPYGGDPLRQQDQVLYREMEKGFDAIANQVAPPAPAAPVGGGSWRADLGDEVKLATQNTLAERKDLVREAYKAFEGVVEPARMQTVIDPESLIAHQVPVPPDMPATKKAIEAISQTNLMNRKETGTEGLSVLRGAMRDAQGVQSFRDLETVRQALGDKIKMWDPGSMTGGAEAQLHHLHGVLKADELAYLKSGGGTNSPQARQLGEQARALAHSLFSLEEHPLYKRVFGDELRLSEIPRKVEGMTPEEVRHLKQLIGAEDVNGLLPQTAEGEEAWRKIARTILDDLKQTSQNVKESDVASKVYVLSGDRLTTALRKYKPGVLEEILGPDVTEQLFNFSEAAEHLTVPQRLLANLSGTTPMAQNPLMDLPQITTQPMGTIAKIASKAATIGGAGWLASSPGGRNFLLGKKPLQQVALGTLGKADLNLLGIIGRMGGQESARKVRDVFAPRQR